MISHKNQVIYSETKAKIKDIFQYLGYYPDCDFIFHTVYDSDSFNNIPEISDLPLLLWHAGEAFIEDTSKLTRNFVYVTGNALLPYHFNIHDIAANKIWQKQISYNKDKTKKFLFLNGKDVGHRRYLLAELYHKGILNDCIWSYIEQQSIDWWFHKDLGFSNGDREYANSVKHIIPYKPFDSTNLIRNLSQSIYSDTYMSIIGETTFQHYRNQTVPLMLTEKTYSACANLHMFIIAGPMGSLNLLKQQGFETFGDLWDESYDTIANTKQRLQAVCNTIDFLSKQDLATIYAKCEHRLKHNQSLIYNINIKNRVDKVTEWLTKLDTNKNMYRLNFYER